MFLWSSIPRVFLAALMMAGWVSPTRAQGTAEELRFNVPPYLSPTRLETLYTPLAALLSEELGRRVVFRTSSNFDNYYRQVAEGNFDFTLIHAFTLVDAVDNFGYVPMARMREDFTGMVVVLEDSPLRNLGDLRGKLIATPPENLPTVHLVRGLMRQMSFDPDRDFTLRDFRSVESCLQQVVIGQAAACVCPPFALPPAQAHFKVKFRAVAESAPIPNITFIAHKRMPSELRARLQQAIERLNQSEEGRQVIGKLGTSGFVPVNGRNYDGVRQLLKQLDKPWPSLPR